MWPRYSTKTIGINPSAVLYFSLYPRKKKRKETLFGAGISNSASVDHQRCGLRKLHVRLQEHSLFDVIIIVK